MSEQNPKETESPKFIWIDEAAMPLTRQNHRMLEYFRANAEIPEIAKVLTKRIEGHQLFILTTHCETPAVIGGDTL